MNLLKKAALAVAISAVASSAFAGGFDGPFVQASLGWAKTETKLTGEGDSVTWRDSNFVGKLAAGYGYSFGAFNLSGNVFYVVGDLKSGSKVVPGDGTFKGKGTNTYGLSVEPGWNVSESTLAYAKLSYVHTTVKASWVSTDGTERDALSRGSSGFGYGIGVKQKFTQNLYGLAEIEQIDFEKKDGLKPSTFGAYVGVGYKF